MQSDFLHKLLHCKLKKMPTANVHAFYKVEGILYLYSDDKNMYLNAIL